MKKTSDKKIGQEPHIKFAVISTDVVLFTIKNDQLMVRLMQVDRPPYFNNIPGLPGGLVLPSETAIESALRQIDEKSGIDSKKVYIEQLHTFSSIDRDPRGRVVSVAHIGFVPWQYLNEDEKTDGADFYWGRVDQARKYAYDHKDIINFSLKWCRARVHSSTIISKIIPEQFTLTELEKAFEIITGKDIDKRNFRKKFDKLNILKNLGINRTGEKHRPAALYSFKSKNVIEIEVL